MEWVESGGGPLLVAPISQLPHWGGALNDDGSPDDYSRACAIEGYIGLVAVGARQALVLGDEPATTTYLPEDRLFLRWSAADSETELVTAARRLVHTAAWEEHLAWTVDGPVALFDSASPGATPEPGNHLIIDLPPSRYQVKATHMETPRTQMTLINLHPDA